MNNFSITKHINIRAGLQVFLLPLSGDAWTVNPAIIPAVQREELKLYKFARDTNKRILARTFLYEYVQEVYKINNFELGYNRYQKPFLKSNPGIQFSFSYSDNYILIGISENKQIGVDIEMIRPEISATELAPDIMCPEEWMRFNRFPENSPEQTLYFFKLFSCKESIIKAFGTGLYMDVKKINTSGQDEFMYEDLHFSYHDLGIWSEQFVLSLCFEK